jgi:hypothetical protein
MQVSSTTAPKFEAWKTLRTHLIVNAQYGTLKPDYDLHQRHSELATVDS